MEQRAGSGTNHLRVEDVHAVVHQHHASATGRIRGTNHGAGVARIAHLPERGDHRAFVEIAINDGGIEESAHVGDGEHSLRVGAHVLHDGMRHLVHVSAGLHGLAGHLRHGRRDESRVRLGRDDLHIQILDDVGMPGEQFTYRLRSFHHEPAGPLAAFPVGKFGDPADAFGPWVCNDFGFHRHTR